MEYALVDATIVKVHRHGQGSKGGLEPRPSAAPRAASPPKSSPSPTPSATWCVSSCCPDSASTRSACRRSWTVCPWSADRRQGLRQQRHHCRSERTQPQDRHLAASPPRVAPAARPGNVQMASFDRKLLLQAQGVQNARHARRQDRHKLRRHHQSCRSRDKLRDESQQALDGWASDRKL